MSHEKCTGCGTVYTEAEVEEMTECTFAETRYEPAEYEAVCCHGHELVEFTTCDNHGCTNEPHPDHDLCADCWNDLDPEDYAEYLAGRAA